MLPLAELQKHFASALNSKNNDIQKYIKRTNKLSVKEQWNIYQSSHIAALQKTLMEVFPVCLQLVGEDFFLIMINRYINNNPSKSFDLAQYGNEFSKFILTYKPAESLPYLSDVAKLEWAWHKIFSSKDENSICFEKLKDCSATYGEKIIFSLPRGSFLLRSYYPLYKIWQVNQEYYDGNKNIVLEKDVIFYFFVCRKKLDMRINTLSQLEWQILRWIKSQLTLGEIVERFSNAFPNDNLVERLPHIVNQGWITDFRVAHVT